MKRLDLSKITAKLERVPKELEGRVAQIGFGKSAVYEDGTQVAYVAAIQEFGAPAASIPARPFFRPAISDNKEKWVKLLTRGTKAILNEEMSGDDLLDSIGAVAAIDVQDAIIKVDSPALSPITVLLRKWKKDGRKITGKTVGEAAAAIAAGEDPGSDNKPLNATGYMIASVRHAVNKEGEEME